MTTPIAIVGMSCRLPGASSISAFWELLKGGCDAIKQVPADRWDADAYYAPDPAAPGKMNSRHGGFLEDIDLFDADFFGITPREADLMDPQQRLLLETTWEALEDAAIAPASLAGASVGVFMGVGKSDYASLTTADPVRLSALTNSGASISMASSRISYALDLCGPSLTIDTACASSLVAVHLACQSLASGESSLALAGGANIILLPSTSIALSKSKLLSNDGRCRVFDASAAGFGRGEGAGVVVLKRLEQALADGDPIHAVLLGSSMRQGARTNGLGAPSRRAQEETMARACGAAGVRPDQLNYIECHSAATPLGDATELNALASVMKERPAHQSCRLGSVKTNIGHLEAASGIAALMKTVLMLKHRTLVPSLHFDRPNALANLAAMPLHVQREAEPWNAEQLLAGVSSSGFGGVYCHAVLRSAPVRPAPAAGAAPSLLTLSARSSAALATLARRQAEQLQGSLAQICYSANVGRNCFAHRAAIVASDHEQLRERLISLAEGRETEGLYRGVAKRAGGASREALLPPSLPPTQLAEKFVAGARIDWRALPPEQAPPRVSLPAYPFQRRRHWFAEVDASAPSTTVAALGPEQAAPESELERNLLAIWHEVLGRKNIGVSDNFFDVGGSSLLAAEMFAKLAERHKLAPSPSLLLEQPTVRKLAAALTGHRAAGPDQPLVAIREGGAGTPLFVVAPDHLFHFTHLFRRIAPGRPIYGLQPPYRDGFRRNGITIEQMAEHYLPEIDRVAAGRPVHLLGLCAGGVVAYEAAVRLRQQGGAVGMLALIDAPCPLLPSGKSPSRLELVVQHLLRHATRLRKLSVADAFAYLNTRVRFRLQSLLSPLKTKACAGEDAAGLASIANRSAIYRYRPPFYDGMLRLLLATEPYPSVELDTRKQWQTLAPKSSVRHFPGHHDKLLQPPVVEELSAALNELLKDADNPRRPPLVVEAA